MQSRCNKNLISFFFLSLSQVNSSYNKIIRMTFLNLVCVAVLARSYYGNLLFIFIFLWKEIFLSISNFKIKLLCGIATEYQPTCFCASSLLIQLICGVFISFSEAWELAFPSKHTCGAMNHVMFTLLQCNYLRLG